MIFVHGIGDQKAGATLEDGFKCLKSSFSDVKIVNTFTIEGRQAYSCEGTMRTGTTVKLLCVDGYWNDLVAQQGRPPNVWSVWAWCFYIVPVMLVNSVALVAMGHYKRFDRVAAPARNSLSVFLSDIWRMIVLPPLLFVAYIISTVVLIAGHLTPFRTRITDKFIQVVQNSIGDAWFFAASKDREQIIRSLTQLTLATSRQAERVVLVGHSQGGALVRSVSAELNLSQEGVSRNVDVVTIGSGANILGMARSTKVWHFLYAFLMILTAPLQLVFGASLVLLVISGLLIMMLGMILTMSEIVFAAIFGERTLDLFDSPGWNVFWMGFKTTIFGAAVELVILLFILLVLYLVGRLFKAKATPIEMAVPQGTWYDISSVYDPVCPGGSHFEEADYRYQVVNGTGFRDLPVEHSSYFRNSRVGAILAAALDVAPPPLEAVESDKRLLLRLFWAWGWVPTFMILWIYIRVFYLFVSSQT